MRDTSRKAVWDNPRGKALLDLKAYWTWKQGRDTESLEQVGALCYQGWRRSAVPRGWEVIRRWCASQEIAMGLGVASGNRSKEAVKRDLQTPRVGCWVKGREKE